MPKGKVEVRTGLIGTESDQTPSPSPLAAAEANAKNARPAAPNEVVFNARAVYYMFQITAPSPIFDPATGRFTEQRPKVAKFQNSEYRTSDPDVIAILKASPSYGIGRDFWDVAELREKTKQAAEENLLKSLQSDPELAARVLSRLAPNVESFAPPQP